MKFKVSRKILEEKLKQFVSRGRLTLLGKDKLQLKTAGIIADEGIVQLYGTDSNAVLFGNICITCAVEETGEGVIGDVESLYNTVKNMKGDIATVTKSETSIKVSDGRKNLTLGVETVPIKTQLKEWYAHNNYVNGDVVFQHLNKENLHYEYKPWFTIANGENLGDIESTAIKIVRTDRVVFDTDTSLGISCANKQITRDYDEEFIAEVKSVEKMILVNIFPILNNLAGKTEFLYYVTKATGALRIWVHNGDMDWMTRCPAKVNQEDEQQE